MAETATVPTTVSVISYEGVLVNNPTNTEPPLEIMLQTQNNKKATNNKTISDEFRILVSTLIFLILITIPLLYISSVGTFQDYDICLKHKQYSFYINKIFLLGSIMSILTIPLSKYKMCISYPNNCTKIVLITIHVIMVILLIVLFQNYKYYSNCVIIISIYGIILFFNEIFMISNKSDNNIYNNLNDKHPMMYLSILNSLFLIILSCVLIYIAIYEVSMNNDCEEYKILKDIMIRCSIFYVIISVIGLWITLNINQRVKYFCKQSLCLYDMAQNDEIHIKQMEKGKLTSLMCCFLIYFETLFVAYFGMCFWILHFGNDFDGFLMCKLVIGLLLMSCCFMLICWRFMKKYFGKNEMKIINNDIE
eukprot:142731_1